MSSISFQSEQPSELDVFPGGSHEKVAIAMCEYLADDKNSRIIGLDGEFGSGKSSILKMLEHRLVNLDKKYRIWFFDCEQNYQGSIKSNFIELFTEELLEKAGVNDKTRELLKDSRDRALGRQFTYTKNTISRVSAWALILVVALFFSTSSFKELFTIAKLKDTFTPWIYVHILSFISPLLVLFLAHLKLKDTKVGDQPWSIYHLFKGGSDDTITEKIKVAKEVTPLDLKRTLENDLKLFKDLHYVIILDNLDRLPKDSLRAVWSDLEIFTWITADNNLSVIVPFCSNKIAKFLSPENERTYDARDFIAKKFPVVFRAPPIITAGWKDGFHQLWQHTFPDATKESSEHCALLLQRHSPMRSKLVTPRLQKRFINDIATTSLTMGEGLNLICIAAHLLLCKYDDLPIEEAIRANGVSENFKKSRQEFDEASLSSTKKFLERHVGVDLDGGWQIQFLQIHFLTSKKIAMAELIDEPLTLAIEDNNGERLAELTSTFGFNDAFKRYLSNETYTADIIRTLALASDNISEENFKSVLLLLNRETKSFLGDLPDDEEFFFALKTCIKAGLSNVGFNSYVREMSQAVSADANEDVDPDDINLKRDRLYHYDNLIDALGIEPSPITVDNAAYYTHVFFGANKLTSLKNTAFKFDLDGRKSIYNHIVSLPNSTTIISITEDQREFLLGVLTGSEKNSNSPTMAMSESDAIALSRSLVSYPNNEAILFGLALTGKLPDTVISQISAQNAEERTLNQKAAIAVIMFCAKKISELEAIDDLDTVVGSDVFKLLFRGSGYSDILTTEYANPTIGSAVSRVLAWGIQNKAIHTLRISNVGANFTNIATAIGHFGVDAQSIFNWLNGWESYLAVNADSIAELDVEFILKIIDSPESQFSQFKSKLVDFYNDLTPENWELILLCKNDNHDHLVDWAAKRKAIDIDSGYRLATISLVKEIVTETKDLDAKPFAVRSMTKLSTFGDQAQNNLLGTEIRNLVYTENSNAEHSVWAIKKFGQLIVDIQPSNTAEIGKLMGILNYLNTPNEESKEVLGYLEARAKQIASFNYSPELRDAMALAISKHKESAPLLYKAFSRKSSFKQALRDLRNPEKTVTKSKSTPLAEISKDAKAVSSDPEASLLLRPSETDDEKSGAGSSK